MTDIRVEIIRDEAGKPSKVVIRKGGRHLEVFYDQYGFTIPSGRLPADFAEILKLVFPYVDTQDVKVSNITEFQNPLTGRMTTSETSFVERWEYLRDQDNRKWMFQQRYTGRSFPLSPVWASECSRPPETWTLPNLKLNQVAAGEALDLYPFNNVVDMTNSKDGKTVDEIYIEPRITFRPPVIMKLQAKIPDPAGLGANDNLLFGFEINSQGGHAINCVRVNNNPHVRCFNFGTAGLEDQTFLVNINNPAVFAYYFLAIYPPKVHFWQSPVGSPEALPTAVEHQEGTFAAADIGYDDCNAFVTNESPGVVSGFEINHWAVWMRSKAP